MKQDSNVWDICSAYAEDHCCITVTNERPAAAPRSVAVDRYNDKWHCTIDGYSFVILIKEPIWRVWLKKGILPFSISGILGVPETCIMPEEVYGSFNWIH